MSFVNELSKNVPPFTCVTHRTSPYPTTLLCPLATSGLMPCWHAFCRCVVGSPELLPPGVVRRPACLFQLNRRENHAGLDGQGERHERRILPPDGNAIGRPLTTTIITGYCIFGWFATRSFQTNGRLKKQTGRLSNTGPRTPFLRIRRMQSHVTPPLLTRGLSPTARYQVRRGTIGIGTSHQRPPKTTGNRRDFSVLFRPKRLIANVVTTRRQQFDVVGAA